jgi:hypothetical protein
VAAGGLVLTSQSPNIFNRWNFARVSPLISGVPRRLLGNIKYISSGG